MSGLEALLPFIYHEKQQSGSQLCAQHALNAILQGDFFSAPDLAQFAQQLDSLEGSFNDDAGPTSNNMDDTGFFSVQVLEGALRVWGFTLVRWRSQELRDQQENPHAQMAFVLNHQQHWFTLRRFGSLEDPDNGHWFNLNSFLKQPEWVGKLYLGMVLSQAEDEGYSVFAVLPISEAADGPTTIPRTEADEIASTLPQPTSSHMGFRLSTSRVTTVSDTAGTPDGAVQPSGFEDEDLELQAALQASLMAGGGEINYAALAASRAQGPSVLHPTSSSHLPSPPTHTAMLPEESQVDTPVAEDPVAASMARNKAIMQRMLREQEMALREGYEDEVALGFGGLNGARAAPQRGGEPSFAGQSRVLRTAGEEEEAEAVRKAIEESQAEGNHDEHDAGAPPPELMDISDSDEEWRPRQESVAAPDSSSFSAVASRVYDDEDSELQAALKASLEGIPEGFVVPPTPPRKAHISSSEAAPVVEEPSTEEGEEEEEVKPVEVLDAEEMRRRRLARFAT